MSKDIDKNKEDNFSKECMNDNIIPKRKNYVACEFYDLSKRVEFDDSDELLSIKFVKNKELGFGSYRNWSEHEGFRGFTMRGVSGDNCSYLYVRFQARNSPCQFDLIPVARIYPIADKLGWEVLQ